MPADRRPRPARGARPARSGAGLARPRGPLPARVYWTRRLVLLGLVLATVLGVGRLLGTGSDGDTAVDRATTAAAVTTDTTDSTGDPGVSATDPGTSATQGPSVAATSDDTRPTRKERARRTRKPRPAVPTGRCEDGDVRVVPVVDEAVGGSDIAIGLELRTVEAEACFWRVSPDNLTLKITSGEDEIWTSRQCPRAVPRRTVVVRSATGTTIEVPWSGRRSDEECSQLTEWALPGWYHVEAAALGGEPADLQFEVTAPEPEVITHTVEPEPKRGRAGDRQRDGQRDR